MGNVNAASSKKFVSEFIPRFSDFDIQGILNSRQYTDLLNEARFDQMRRCYNRPIEEYVKKGLHWVVSALNFNFLRQIFPGQTIFVFTQVTEIKGPKAYVEFSFETVHKNGINKVHATGSTEYVLIDIKTKSPLDISDEEKKIYL